MHVCKDGRDVWVGTQAMTRAQAADKATGLSPDKVIVHDHLIGGGFGHRPKAAGVARAAQIARHVEGPVKVVWRAGGEHGSHVRRNRRRQVDVDTQQPGGAGRAVAFETGAPQSPPCAT